MTVFRAFLKVLNQCRIPIILYTVLLVGFGGFQMQTNESSMGFTASRPEISIINRDENAGITRGLLSYMAENCEIREMKEEELDDALFYRDVSYILYIPENYGKDFLEGRETELEVKSTGDYHSSYAEMLLSRYLKTARAYVKYAEDGEELAAAVSGILEKQVSVEVTSKLDTGNLEKAAFYYNFLNYSLLAGCVYVICLVLSSFREEKIRRRTAVSSMDYRKMNRLLLLSNGLFAFALWLLYVILSFVLVGKVMFTAQGLLYVANSFVFMVCSLAIAFLIGNLVVNKNALNGIVNVVALGSSFLCGAFVPAEWLPDSVLKAAHILPSYWYIQTNEFLKTMEDVSFTSVRPILVNIGVILGFTLIFIVAADIISKKREKFSGR